jgi:hypothetical protein
LCYSSVAAQVATLRLQIELPNYGALQNTHVHSTVNALVLFLIPLIATSAADKFNTLQ